MRICALFIGLAVILTGCESSSGSSQQTEAAPPTETIRVEPDLSAGAKDAVLDPLLPPGGTDRPARPGELDRARDAANLPILDAKGLTADQLFTQRITDPDRRMERLENAVVEIRRDLDAALPAISRLVAIEGDIQQLVSQLQALVRNEDQRAAAAPQMVPLTPEPTPAPAPTPVSLPTLTPEPSKPSDVATPSAAAPVASPTPVLTPVKPELSSQPRGRAQPIIEPQANIPVVQPSSTVAPKPATAAPMPKPVASKMLSISSIRLGDHADKVRIVIETAVPLALTPDLDTTENILTADLDGPTIQAGRSAAGNSLVKSMTLRSTGPTSGQLVLELKGPTEITKTMNMPPNADNPNYRWVIDLAKK